MEDYTLKTTKIDFEKGRISKAEFILISDFIKKRDAYNKAEEVMRKYFRKKFDTSIKTSKTKEDLKQVKEGLRVMPECTGKVLLFRELIMREDLL